MLKFLIAVDDSDHSRRAVEAVARLAPQTKGLEVVLINVRESPLYYGELPPYDYESIDRLHRRRQDTLLESALAQARQCGLEQVTTEAAMGSPANEIVSAADQRTVDQIVIGTHGRGPVGTMFIGSVAQRVVHLSRIPVLLVR